VCWTLWEPPRPQPIYPARRPGPVAETPWPASSDTAATSASKFAAGSDDWDDLRPHRPEDGLALGDTQVAPNTGPEHRDRCLLALALAPGVAP